MLFALSLSAQNETRINMTTILATEGGSGYIPYTNADGEYEGTLLTEALDSAGGYQQVDTFELVGNDLRISLTDDGVGFYEADLSSLGGSGAGTRTREVFFGQTGASVTVSATLPSNTERLEVFRGGLLMAEGASADYTISGQDIQFNINLDNENVVIQWDE